MGGIATGSLRQRCGFRVILIFFNSEGSPVSFEILPETFQLLLEGSLHRFLWGFGETVHKCQSVSQGSIGIEPTWKAARLDDALGCDLR